MNIEPKHIRMPNRIEKEWIRYKNFYNSLSHSVLAAILPVAAWGELPLEVKGTLIAALGYIGHKGIKETKRGYQTLRHYAFFIEKYNEFGPDFFSDAILLGNAKNIDYCSRRGFELALLKIGKTEPTLLGRYRTLCYTHRLKAFGSLKYDPNAVKS